MLMPELSETTCPLKLPKEVQKYYEVKGDTARTPPIPEESVSCIQPRSCSLGGSTAACVAV